MLIGFCCCCGGIKFYIEIFVMYFMYLFYLYGFCFLFVLVKVCCMVVWVVG